METLSAFLIAFLFSFIGTIPPGTMNLTIIQLGLKQRMRTAWRLALAAALIEYPYAWIAVQFQDYLVKSVDLTHNFHLVSALVMMTLGILTFWSAGRPSRFSERFEGSGFRKGIVLGILNPLAIPFWVAMTAYLQSYGWVKLSDGIQVQAYLVGVSMGTLVVLMLYAYLARTVISYVKDDGAIKKVPGVILTLLGIYSLTEYMFG